ncbi:CDP-glycerol glycerophosphotransferase family protein [Phocaeicola sp. Sa1YUN3]|uniref:CDP-glycerol glycerophosphotransferase family protein n=2 Tax=Phocaeicola faecium TaxID=2762213 RepID=A0ABR8VFD3_9BACT|nr:CDP-glycerol glycerophosphotransferase family protein [Phocaeicola faecium]
MKRFIYSCLSWLFILFFPIKRNKIFFMSYYGNQYGCNPKYLSQYIVTHYPDYDIVWAFVHPKIYHNISGIRTVKYLSIRYFYELCTCKVLITNYRMTLFFKKRKGQYYIQTWHSSLRLKMIEKDAEHTLPLNYKEMALKDSLNIDYLISGCAYSTSIFRSSFWYKGNILELGTPRNDLFFSANTDDIKRIKGNLNIQISHKVLLYAPTFRQNNQYNYYDLNYEVLLRILEKNTDSSWKILIRLHPHLLACSNNIVNNSIVQNVTDYDDIQELLLISDILITDYSSLMFDFALTQRPCFLYAPDLDEYIKNERNLYFDIQSLPFPISRNEDELVQAVSSFDLFLYKERLMSFFSKIKTFESGSACKNISEKIQEIIEK